MKVIAIFFLFIFAAFPLAARRILVSTGAHITAGGWNAGDTIIMKNGTWLNQTITLKVNGTASQPVVLMAQTPGGVVLKGTSHLGFSGSFIEISGLYFKDGNLSGTELVSFRTSSSEFAENCRLTNTAIVNCNPVDKTIDSKWVSLHGKNNRIDHCSFQNKTNSGTLLVVWLTSGIIPNHIIEQNYFGYRNSNLDANGAELNGQEIIRVGDSSTSMQTAGVQVVGNFFEHCNGEIEVISNKSCFNYYSNNVFFECHGMLTLRHGNSCTVDGNYFFGNGISSTGGVRIIGENHKVYNNYFENLHGTDARSAICMMRGKLNSLPNEYFQVKNALVAFNTMVDCSQAFSLNYNSGNTYTMPPIGSVIAHNHVYNTSASNTNVDVDLADTAMDVKWLNNLMNQGKYTNFAFDATQIVTGKSPLMTLAGTSINMFEPAAGSALSSYSTTDFAEILSDIRGRSRGIAKLPGASQISDNITRIMPMKSNVGAAFLRDTITGIQQTLPKVSLNVYVSHNQLISYVSSAGELLVFDAIGQCLVRKTVSEGTFTLPFRYKGLYILKFISREANLITRKIYIA